MSEAPAFGQVDKAVCWPLIGQLHRYGQETGPCFDCRKASWEELGKIAIDLPQSKPGLLTEAPARLDRIKLAAQGRLSVWDQLDGAIVGAVWPDDDPVLVYDFDAVIRDLLIIFETGDWMAHDERLEFVTRWFHENLWEARLGPSTPFYLLRLEAPIS